MRKKAFITFMMAVLVGAMLAGCGKKAEKVDSSNVVIEEEEQEQEPEEIAEPEETAEPEPEEPEEEPVDEPEPEPADWLEEHGITITPQGDCQVTLLGYEKDGETFVGDFDAAVNVTISETEEGADEGFKKVSALFTMDLSNNPGESCGGYWRSAFDRYTGTSFEFDSIVTHTHPGDHVAREGYTTIQNGDEYYDVSIEFLTDNQFPIIYETITVTCPVDYDGTVFQIGYCSPELREQNSQIDYSARLYTIDELPYFGDRYLYFTMSND